MPATRVLVTGAGGFLGRHLVKQLNDLGWSVFDTRGQNGFPENRTYDITDRQSVENVVSNASPDVVFHLAGLTPSNAPSATYDDYIRVNVGGTLGLLDAVHRFVPSARIILVTSSAMYGQAKSVNGVIEEDDLLQPVNPYGVSKATQHLLGFQYYVQHKVDIVRVCPFNLIGYSLPSGLAASDFARQIAAIERGTQAPVLCVGDLTAQRDFLDVQDAVGALISLADKGVSGESYNLASAQGVPINSLLKSLMGMSNVAIEIHQEPRIARSSVPIQIGSYQKLAEATGWRPLVSLEQSLADVLAYWRLVGTINSPQCSQG